MSLDKSLKVRVLVSVGQHPKSGRERRADQDSRALELALGMPGFSVGLLHAGSESPALREYLGMGVKAIDVLKQPSSADVVPALVQALRNDSPDLVLCGTRAETGEASGMTPYRVANALGWPLVPAVVSISRGSDGTYEVLQALPRGQRRLLKVRTPFVATVDPAAAEARQSAFGPAQRGQLQAVAVASVADPAANDLEFSPARKRPKRIAAARKATTAAERFKAATVKSASKGGQVLVKETAAEKASAILNLLVAEGVIAVDSPS
ncbi:electron transfer flavoprotein subunit beta [Parathalassolituus penaei]|uniref:Electron transfer flavoprotein subunit beta n=1 Tax=Parathalassolituus penaei TaxID=2997323 RepID=A0A9X3EN48_9GAMM|nr:electron transfer flavoprotein subunit beta [Parathalassolituus penaei]MCY0967291.1 electron transfer flavoprotein subunit beta [Parathalassolituus penaei]